MSIRVDVADLGDTLTLFGPGYLLTSSAEGRVKAVCALPGLVGGSFLVTAPGRGSLANAGVHPDVTLLWAPLEPGGHSLLVDGTAVVDGDDLRVTPTSAVLHRAAG